MNSSSRRIRSIALLMGINLATACAMGPNPDESNTASDGNGGNDSSASGGNNDASTGQGSSSSNGASTGGGTDNGGDCPNLGDGYPKPEILPECPSYLCGGGARCVPNDSVPADVQSFMGKCNKDFLCVPDFFVQAGSNFELKSCTAVLGLEGRCISDCIPMVAEQSERLDQGSCDAGELCTPCFDPFTLEPTGACGLSCDKGPKEPPPKALPSCCPANNGTCVPKELVPAESVSSLAQDSCADSNMACVPNEMLDPTFTGTPCAPDILLQLAGIDDGACLPDCVDAVKGIGRGSCPSGYKCAPCDVFGEPTGACAELW